jgi:hypothetical protein
VAVCPKTRLTCTPEPNARGTIEATVECDGVDKPVCIAQSVVLRLA